MTTMHDLGVRPEKSYNTDAPNPIGPAHDAPQYPMLHINAKKDLGIPEGVAHHTVKMALVRHTVDHKAGTHRYEFDVHGIAPKAKKVKAKDPSRALAETMGRKTDPEEADETEYDDEANE